MKPMKVRIGWLPWQGLAALLLMAAAGAAWPQAGSSAGAPSALPATLQAAPQPAMSLALSAALQAEIDRWVMRGYEHPSESMAALAALAGQSGSQRQAILGSGLVAAASGRQAELQAALVTLKGLGSDHWPPPTPRCCRPCWPTRKVTPKPP